MKILLAGLTTAGNLYRFFNAYLKEGDEKKAMKVFLAGPHGNVPCYIKDYALAECNPYILESFYYMNPILEKMLPLFGDFFLDSGAFTFMQNSDTAQNNWDEYLERYAEFINKNKIKHYFELDIDSIVGYDEVLRLRKKLERLTNGQCIPVWHKSRGKEEFIKMCDEYPYVAIGGIVSKEIKRTDYKYFPYFINEAHKRNVKIHGLGFTVLKDLPKYHFDSVDSTAWVTGNRFGFIYKFNGKTLVKHKKAENQKLASGRLTAVNNFFEWVKFQKYAEVHL